MKRIKVIEPYYVARLETYSEDVKRIVMVLQYHHYEATPEQAVRLWELYSESVAADWLQLPTGEYANDELFECIEPYFKVEAKK